MFHKYGALSPAISPPSVPRYYSWPTLHFEQCKIIESDKKCSGLGTGLHMSFISPFITETYDLGIFRQGS